jgi:murein DD-endopeptidase MepM/ murein hydrolase activator NlpD
MSEKTFTRREKIQAGIVGAGAVVLVLLGISQKYAIGQSYQCVSVDGETIGYVGTNVDVKQTLQAARRELAEENDTQRLSIDLDWSVENDRKLFQHLLSEDELKESWKGILEENRIQDKERAYTVAIGDYRANFSSLDEVKEFLDEVKAPSDEAEEYQADIFSKDSHVSGILCAKLVKCEPEEVNEPEVTLAEEAGSGVSQAFAYAVAYAAANPDDGSYKTGILDMEFVENVEVYENYVEASQLSDIDSEVIEVTKEKESNKIYVVQSGDCLSVIAMDHDTTVSSIMALNGMSNADAIIRDGQELIIAVPEPDLKLRITMGEVYEEDYNEDPVIIENDSWYTTKEVVLEEGTTGHRERNDVVVYENGVEASREMIHENVMVASTAAVIEKGTIIPPTYIKPLSGGHFTSGFGYRWGRLHKGVDWGCPVGTKVYASCAGTVIQATYSGGYGNVVVISHPDGRMTRYAHNSKLLVKVGQHVEQGEAIALSGSTGNSTGPHVHFEIYINGSAVNPLKYISY